MNEQRFLRLFRRIVLLSAPIPVATMGFACGGAEVSKAETETPTGTGGSGSSGSGGAAGSESGGSGSTGTGGSTTGTGGSTTGTGGSTTGTSGSTTGGGGSSAGAGGSVTQSDAGLCVGITAHLVCGVWQQILPRSCVDASMAQVGALPPQATCAQLCGPPQNLLPACSVSAIDAESVTIACHTLCVTGRRPEGLKETMGNDSKNPLAAYFAEVARLEAASVDAFRILQGELAVHGAPRKLQRAAGRAARDEIRHARMTKALARRFGGTVKPVVVEKARQRSLEEIAVENAVEGCVRETYGALLATWQAQQARDAGVRAAMQVIAEDETRHAALSWSVARWLDRRLNRYERRRVEQARVAAVEELFGHLAADNDAEWLERAGLPRPEQAAELAHRLTQALWS